MGGGVRRRALTVCVVACLGLSLADAASAVAGSGFVGAGANEAIPLTASTPRAAAREAVERFTPRFGLSGDAELSVTDVDRLPGGRSAFRFQQTVDGLPVIGGQLAVSLDRNEDLLSIGGELMSPAKVDPSASVTEPAAMTVALTATAKHYGVSASSLRATAGELSVYDPRLLGGPGLALPRPVWRFEVTDGVQTIRELVLVDAQRGNVALSFSQIEGGKFRWVCDSAFTDSNYFCQLDDAVRSEGEGASGIAEADSAYDLAGLVHDFYLSRLDRDSIDGNGMPLVTTVRYCEGESCPVYENAFWNGYQATFGPGWMTDDILAHEFTHGLVEAESNLFYYYQSGAINESYADVFGELFDLATGSDPLVDRWLVGEDSSSGAIRDMADPPSFSDPDRTGSPNWYFNPTTSFEKGDAGGVHSNSGVNNKLAYLLTDGDSFNGQVVEAIGADKLLRIYHEANISLLTSASDYADLGQALRQACANLTGLHGLTASDCVQVDRAVLATEMDETVSLGPREAATCTNQQPPVSVFFDDMETPQGNWASSVATGSGAFSYPAHFYAASGSTHIAGYDLEDISDSAIAMTKSISVPPGGLLHFRHAYGFESTEGASYDGGVVEYSTNGGASWHDASGMIVAGEDYSDVLATISDNPLGGRPAFAGDSAGYGSTRLDLTPLVNQSVRFRFRIGTDESVGDYGWFIDDVRIYHCGNAVAAPAATSTPDPQAQPAAAANDDCAKAKLALSLATANTKRARRALGKSQRGAGSKKTARGKVRRQRAVRTATKRERQARAVAEQSCLQA